jgi:hypothetical protein
MPMNKYTIKYQCDFKGDLKEDKYEPTRNDIKTKLLESITSLTTHYDHLTGSNIAAEISAKATVDKVGWWYTGTVTLRIDGSKYETTATIDTNTPIENPIIMITELQKKLINWLTHIKK